MNKRPSPSDSYDVIVLGAGGAGLMCAQVAGQRGLRVLCIDHADAPGKKILISGGGRCNFTNRETPPERFLSANPHFARSALARYAPQDFIGLIERHGIAWHEKTLGQLFCDGSAKQIVAMLLDECARGGVEIALGQPIGDVVHQGEQYLVALDTRKVMAPNLVVATGGPSIPKMGATGYAYELARQFGLKVVEPRPALVPFTLPGTDALFRDLSGVATETIVSCGKAAFREAALFTHRGLSGPAMLQASSYWRHGDAVSVDFLPSGEAFQQIKRDKPKTTLMQALSAHLPARLAETLVDQAGGNAELGAMTDKRLSAFTDRLRAWAFRPNGTEGLAKAEVTAGGVATAGLSSKTMEARKVPGLYFVGEAVDVTGWLGGYNFQWAWASGWAAGQALEKRG